MSQAGLPRILWWPHPSPPLGLRSSSPSCQRAGCECSQLSFSRDTTPNDCSMQGNIGNPFAFIQGNPGPFFEGSSPPLQTPHETGLRPHFPQSRTMMKSVQRKGGSGSQNSSHSQEKSVVCSQHLLWGQWSHSLWRGTVHGLRRESWV